MVFEWSPRETIETPFVHLFFFGERSKCERIFDFRNLGVIVVITLRVCWGNFEPHVHNAVEKEPHLNV